ncbi:polyhydroxyalkanoic acid system family protein [Rhodoferax sp.]|uniref:polyhydroxyalkanoic acid system family protein n=1 Tax=Rhodoferax sp. TaxID=50421 RepID=UPI00374D8ED5
MTDIHMQREHTLGLAGARKLVGQWIEQAETRLGMTCTYTEGSTQDEIAFERAGVSGTVQLTETLFVLDAELGFLFSAFKEKIETEVARRMDKMLAQEA